MMLKLLGDHVWQSTVFAAVAGLLTLAFRHNRAQVRHWIWFAASVKFLIPFAALAAAGSQFAWQSSPAIEQPRIAQAIGTIGQPFSQLDLRFTSSPVAASAPASGAPIVLSAIWFIGSLVVLSTWLVRWPSRSGYGERRVTRHRRPGTRESSPA